MADFVEYFSRPKTQEEYKHLLLVRLIQKYSERGEGIPKFNLNNGKLETENQELRLQYRYMLQGAEVFAALLDHVDDRRKQQQAIAAEQQNPK